MKLKNIRWAVLSMSSVIMISMTASAILADVAAYYPQVALNTIQMVLAVPSLLSMIFALASGPLSGRLSKKTLVLFGLVCGLIGGLMALSLGRVQVSFLIAASVFIGIAQGINSTMTMALIADYFVGEERGSMMGLQSAFANGGSMVILFSGGLLAGVRWDLSYLIYLVFVPVLFIVWRNLPRDFVQQGNPLQSGDGKLNGVVYYNSAMMILFTMLTFVYQSNIALFLRENGLGSASTVGFINAFGTGVGMVTGIFYGTIKNRLKESLMPLSMGAMGVGMLAVALVGTMPVIVLSSFINGFAMSTIIPTVMFNVSNAVSPAKSANAIALANGSISIGLFASPFVMNALSESMRPGDLAFKFLLAALGLLILSFMVWMGNLAMSKQEEKTYIGAPGISQE